ncbi:MAG: hypothetical protein HYY92_02530 [Parcubacteria group bacterium]|nr:hypothetical protein [Parcubacteria group bacterium]
MSNEQMGGNRDRDLVLSPNTFVYALDATKGKVGVYVGPFRVSLSNTDLLVVWDGGKRRFTPVSDSERERAIQVFSTACEG